MTDAIVARRRSEETGPTPGFARIAAALGYEVVDTVEQRREQHNEYGLGPGAVDRLGERLDGLGDPDGACVLVDNRLHEGQLADLAAALSGPVRDRRSVVWDWLAEGGNRVAENRHTALKLRLRRRRLLAGGTSADRGVADLEDRLDRLDAEVDRLRARARDRVLDRRSTGEYRVVIADTTGESRAWAGLTGADADRGESAILRPARPRTETTTVEGYGVAATDAPGTLGGLPGYYRRAVPGTVAAVKTADVVVTDDPALETGTAARVTLGSDSETVRSRVAAALETLSVDVDVELPYTDDGRATSSWLHDVGTVRERAYGATIELRVALSAAALERLRTRLAEADGTVRRREE